MGVGSGGKDVGEVLRGGGGGISSWSWGWVWGCVSEDLEMYLDIIDKPHVLEPVFVVGSVVGHFCFNYLI